MNRRGFLRAVSLSAGGIALLGTEILIPERTYFLPPRSGWPMRHLSFENFMMLPRDPGFLNYSRYLAAASAHSIQNQEWIDERNR